MAGLGVASTQIMPPIAALPYIKITAAADTRTDALGKFRETYGGETFTSVETMCESPCRPKTIESSLDKPPCVDDGIV